MARGVRKSPVEKLQDQLNEVRAVSYTHLDVYKRQLFPCSVKSVNG